METEPKSYVVREMTPSDIDEVNAMRLQSWLDTYPNDEWGVTREWIQQRNGKQLSDEMREKRTERFMQGKETGTLNAWVVRDVSGKVIGATTPFVDDEGVQHVGSLYVDKEWHGKGVGAQLMQRVIDWFDPGKPIVLGVVSYNERAQAFYRKWGFVKTDDPEDLFDGVIPEIHMMRKGDRQ